MISTVTGNFKIFEGTLETETEEFTKAKNLELKAEVKSVNTNNEDRDTHLRSDDFFASEPYSNIQFKAKNFNIETGEIKGDLTIKNTTKSVSPGIDFGGVVIDLYGQTKAGLTANGKFSRKEFGLVWNSITEAGNVVVGDKIDRRGTIHQTSIKPKSHGKQDIRIASYYRHCGRCAKEL